jgi:hypothetical protein
MQEVIKVEPFVPYWVGTDTDEYIFIQPSSLHEELNKFRAVGKRNPYALIYLKKMVSLSDDYFLSLHAAYMRGREVRYEKILQDIGVMDQHKTINPAARTIAPVAIKLSYSAVFVTTLAWFEKHRATKLYGNASATAPADTAAQVKDAQDDDIGGVEYALGDVLSITNKDLVKCQ